MRSRRRISSISSRRVRGSGSSRTGSRVPRVVFTSNLQRHVECPECRVEAATVRDALEAVFASSPALRDYVLDEQGHLRRHVVIYVDGEVVNERSELAQALAPDAEIYVLQALSGG
jgi:molybdopterin synthase sulfur carrier subunit